MENSMEAPQKPKKELPNDPAIATLGIYTKECKSGYNKGTFISMFIASLFIIAKLWKQPRCFTTDEWIKKMLYLYTMEFYSSTKNNEQWITNYLKFFTKNV
jgi:hypothetical protein